MVGMQPPENVRLCFQLRDLTSFLIQSLKNLLKKEKSNNQNWLSAPRFDQTWKRIGQGHQTIF
jgi:hypothetical protein